MEPAAGAEAHAARADAHRRAGRHDEAFAEAELALQLDPACARAHEVLGETLRDVGLPRAAIDSHRRALALGGEAGLAWHRIGLCLADAAEALAAGTAFRRAIALRPDLADARSGLLASRQRLPSAPPQETGRRRIRVAFDARPSGPAPVPGAATGAPLRIGYVSGDFRETAVGWFLRGVIGHHDATRVDVHCYASQDARDPLTEELIGRVPHWAFVGGLDDAALAGRIRADRIDVLVDLAGHGPGNRLGVFARRAAPVQVSWPAIAGSTGLAAMDAVLVGRGQAPPGAEAYFTEALVELESCHVAYAGPVHAPEPATIPRADPVLACFTGLAGIHDGVLDAWSAILAALPGGRLALRDPALNDPRVREAVAGRFALRGIAPARIEFRGPVPHPDHLAGHADVDVVLDPFPASSAIGACEALWMGVPVVTMPGLRPDSRQAAAVLEAVGLGDLVADTPRGYVARAVAICRDGDRRSRLRAGLRGTLRSSELGDGRRVARALEAAFSALVESRRAGGPA